MHRPPPGRLLLVLLPLLMVCPGAGAELADPTRPSFAVPTPGAGAATATALRVSAVFISGERRIALVNGIRVREGETVGGATVSRIERDRVSFVRGGRTFSVALLSGAGRKR